MNYRNFSQVTTRGLTALSLAAAVSGTAQAATPALPLITEVFVNKTGVLGMAWKPVANAASMRLQVASSGDRCPLTTLTRPAGCFVNQVVSLNGPLAPALKTGVSVANYNSGNVYARLVAVDSTGRNMTGTAWIKVPHYLGLTSGGKAWPLSEVISGAPLTVTANVTNGTAMSEFWAFDIQGNSTTKSRSGLNFNVTPMATGTQQAWVMKSKSGGLVIDQGTVKVSPAACAGLPYMDLPFVGNFKVTQGNSAATSHYDHGTWDNTYAIDLALPMNTPVRSPVNGTVIKATGVNNIAWIGGGRTLLIQDSISNKKIALLHLNSISIASGSVKKGDIVGYSGASGCDSKGCSNTKFGPHLHIHLWNGVGTYDSHTEAFPSNFRLRVKTTAGSEACLYGNDLANSRIVGTNWTSHLN